MRHGIRLSSRLLAPFCAIAATTFFTPNVAEACGGFFCDNVQPVVQTAERILFRMNEDGTITAVVEVQYEGPPSNFGWVVPVPKGLKAEDIGTVEAGFFDTLEEFTAPVFEEADYGAADGAADSSAGCGCGPLWGGPGGGWNSPPPPDTSGVKVVGEAVVGPYDVEIIEAAEGDNLSNWLIANGYQIPTSAADPMQHYIEAGSAFIGLKLNADAPAGPIDAITFTYEGTSPSIPLILTAVACASELEIVAYVAGAGRYAPGNYVDLDFDYDSVQWVDAAEGTTTYENDLRSAVIDAGGQAFNTEFAASLTEHSDLERAGFGDFLPRTLYMTRFHTFMSPLDMSDDPWWAPSTLDDVDNHHIIWGTAPDDDGQGRQRGPDWAWGLLVPVVFSVRRRRRSRAQ